MKYRCRKCQSTTDRKTPPIFGCPGPHRGAAPGSRKLCQGKLDEVHTPADLFDLQAGEERKAAGRDRVELLGKDFMEWARAVARSAAAASPEGTATIDDIRRQAVKENIQPHHANCWGAVFKGPEWADTGRYIKSTFTSNNAHRIVVWRLRKENAT